MESSSQGPADRTIVVWYRRDLRVADNEALWAAVHSGARVVPVFVSSEDDEQPWQPGAAQRWWIHHSLVSLRAALAEIGLDLVVRKGAFAKSLIAIASEVGADAVFANRRFEPHAASSDAETDKVLSSGGISLQLFDGFLLHDPAQIRTGAGGPYRVFTPFWRRLQEQLRVPPPVGAPELSLGQRTASPGGASIDLGSIESLGLLPTVNWTAEIARTWVPSEAGAHAALDEFVTNRNSVYESRRDFPAELGTSRVSPFLANGQLSPRQIWYAVARSPTIANADAGAHPYLRQLGWREFSYHVLRHNPFTSDAPLNARFVSFPWRRSKADLQKWQRGQTGYPIVDAGMRELWATGWMHNRVRMVVASFLTKHLLLNWRHGAAWFWDTLVDADLGNNTMGWQWSAGTGADAQPYFRVFNPTTQGKKFDRDGTYVRRWLPELARLENKYLHAPWDAPDDVLERAGVRLGETYPKPIVPHAEARERALAAYGQVKG
ncbi:MAG: deoxyribodipyrimidine photo-lyase [Rhodothermales bacterium]|nr:deoxyribodipyrimidine photo-lyase [Rhodothermales bacterium]